MWYPEQLYSQSARDLQGSKLQPVLVSGVGNAASTVVGAGFVTNLAYVTVVNKFLLRAVPEPTSAVQLMVVYAQPPVPSLAVVNLGVADFGAGVAGLQRTVDVDLGGTIFPDRWRLIGQAVFSTALAHTVNVSLLGLQYPIANFDRV